MQKKIALLLFLSLALVSVLFSQNNLTVLSYNIWFDNPSNTDHPWSERKSGVIETLQKLNPDIFCLQEAMINQVHDLQFGSYQYAGVGRDDGKDAGEFSAIFYDTTRFERLDANTFWLSETPDRPGSKGWDAFCVRIATWIQLKDIESGKTLFVFNTHFDHVGDTARLESSKLLKKKIEEISLESPVILTGDFNCKKGSGPYQVIVDPNQSLILQDSRDVARDLVIDPEYSFVGSDCIGKKGDIIDHIFVSSNLHVQKAFIYDNCVIGNCPSDHLPLIVKLVF
ncbi:MAG: endonuclease/exonuclease/phosphatase family protein [Bacteroidetes bacterium]|nr:endonuclease/exonuclease/phosphatase family protein [Bacteroidota bacterium]